MHSLHLYSCFFEKQLEGFSLFERAAEADPAVRAEVAGDRDEFYGESILPGLLLSPDRMVNGWKEDDSVRHD